ARAGRWWQASLVFSSSGIVVYQWISAQPRRNLSSAPKYRMPHSALLAGLARHERAPVALAGFRLDLWLLRAGDWPARAGPRRAGRVAGGVDVRRTARRQPGRLAGTALHAAPG